MTLKEMQARLKWTADGSLPFIPTMTSNDLATKVGAAIRTARKRRNLVMRDIAEAVGVKTGAVGNWERGANVLTMENLQLVANYLRIDALELGRGNLRFLDDESDLSDAEVVGDPTGIPAGGMDVELLGGAVAGDDADFTLNGEIAGYVRRPIGLVGLKKVFAVNVLSDSMVPRYDPGELLYCGGRAPVIGDHIVIELHPPENSSVGKAYVKKLIGRTATHITCQQYNPPKTMRFDISRIKNIWRVIPSRELFGF